MDINDLEKLLSEKRLSTYYKLFYKNKEKAIEYYRLNIQISESFYPLLSTLEIVLRNSIHSSFSIHFKSADWASKFKQPELIDQINVSKKPVFQSRLSFRLTCSKKNQWICKRIRFTDSVPKS
jgi:hypothetical protein